jgi:hypothetical protein
VKEAQGSVINLDTNKPETANVAMSTGLGGDNKASCGLWLTAVRPSYPLPANADSQEIG